MEERRRAGRAGASPATQTRPAAALHGLAVARSARTCRISPDPVGNGAQAADLEGRRPELGGRRSAGAAWRRVSMREERDEQERKGRTGGGGRREREGSRGGLAVAARPPRPPRGAARLRPARGGGYHVAGRGVGLRGRRRRAPQRQRPLPRVSVDYRASFMIYWIVERIPAREDGIPALPAPPPNPPYVYLPFMFIYLEPFVRALEDGYYPEDEGWRLFWFRGGPCSA